MYQFLQARPPLIEFLDNLTLLPQNFQLRIALVSIRIHVFDIRSTFIREAFLKIVCAFPSLRDLSLVLSCIRFNRYKASLIVLEEP